MKQYFVYIIHCKDGTFYIGITTDLSRRIKQHNGLIKGGAKYTRFNRPVALRYYEIFPDRSSASQREYQLKQLTHQEKRKICDRFSCLLQTT